jgi:hypothetical protein
MGAGAIIVGALGAAVARTGCATGLTTGAGTDETTAAATGAGTDETTGV